MYRKTNEHGAVLPIVVIILLLLGILFGTKLIKIPNILKSQAGGGPITVRTSNGTALPKEGESYVTDSLDVQLELNPPTP